ncbi:MAG: hydroxyacid dehydrogenase [Verrucomicrobiaceae bacterium]|nr:hydroxyacid dehydrogenase [Verrucomicrobiaceae bacterium]
MTAKLKLLQNGRLSPYLEQRLAQQYDVHFLEHEPDARAFLLAHGHEFVALATSVQAGADKTLFDALPNLRVVSSFGVGFDKLDLNIARERGIAIGYTPDVLSDCVADLAFGLLIDVARSLSASDRFVRRGEWLQHNFPLTTRVSGKNIGVLGLGRIGRAIAKRASGFDMAVRYHNRSPVADVEYVYEADLVTLPRWSDFLVIAAPGGASTEHIVSTDVLTALGPQGFVINIARGSVIDERALVEALEQNRIAGAALDVFEHEPNVPAELLNRDNVVLLPHVGSGTVETRQAMADRVLDNLTAFFEHGKVISSPLTL